MEPKFEEVLEKEYPHLKDKIYVDYAGSMVMCKSQTKLLAELTADCHANPHSSGQISQPISDMEDLRSVVCNVLGTNPGVYSVIFTQNASHSIHIIGELFKWDATTKFSYLYDNHNSIFGLRSFAESHNTNVECVFDFPTKDPNHHRQVFAYPYQSNFSGHKYPLSWIPKFQEDDGIVIFDAAASTVPDLSTYKPDFIVLSLLKLTGAHGGVLLVRRDRVHLLNDAHPAGGTVLFSCARSGEYKLLPFLHQQLEAGTPSYIDLALSLEGFRVRRLLGTEQAISQRVTEISDYFASELEKMEHSNGRKLATFAPPREKGDGGTISFNLYGTKGELLSHYDIQFCFSVFEVIARFGGHCNPGAGFTSLGWKPEEIAALGNENEKRGKCISNLCTISSRPVGTIRISFGATSTMNDAERLLSLIKQQFLNDGPCPPVGKIVLPLKIMKIFVFPIVGALGFETNNWEISDYGLKYDRVWKLVGPDGNLAATTHLTRLMSLYASIDEDNNELILKCNDKSLKVKINDFKQNENAPDRVKEQGLVYDESVSDFLFDCLGRYLYLVKVKSREEGRMAFSAITYESLKFLGDDFDLLRFRANLILSGAPAFTEEGTLDGKLCLHGLEIDKWKWRIICMTTSINPKDQRILREPLKKLTYERGRNGAVTFGVLFNVDCQKKTYTLSTGEEINYKDK
ncbi:MOSC N-terminal beta barrel domain containing protein [Histomonas meleagridis]|uniref:MOSC N-terminal beta barrel domain containing protein n=1 Tax=Histomonas meleagridis TaxID=135588 RepID=UPI00355ABB65|nr:MOSC N-terminal beta barrel domain containing protein [Histomonas meleagridis]KAH0805379.1 MOSC N-terminal beta barrel domain containing protein [Histomonas meleagridis]